MSLEKKMWEEILMRSSWVKVSLFLQRCLCSSKGVLYMGIVKLERVTIAMGTKHTQSLYAWEIHSDPTMELQLMTFMAGHFTFLHFKEKKRILRRTSFHFLECLLQESLCPYLFLEKTKAHQSKREKVGGSQNEVNMTDWFIRCKWCESRDQVEVFLGLLASRGW